MGSVAKFKVDDFAVFINAAIQIAPVSFNLDIGLIHPLTAMDRAFVLACLFLQKRRMINVKSTLFHHLLDVSVAQRIGHVPMHALQDDIRRITEFNKKPLTFTKYIDQNLTPAQQFSRLATV